MHTNVIPNTPAVVLSTPVIWFMAFAAALGTASIYPLQPAIADVAASTRASLGAVGVTLACGPLGYLVGLILLVPLVDRFSPRRVLSTQFGGLALALALNAVVSTPWLMGLVIAVIGACSSVGAQLSSVAARFAESGRRATVLGIVTAGISAGILAGRIVGGWLNDEMGWRGMLLVLSVASAAIAVMASMVLPAASGSISGGFVANLARLPGLFRVARLRLAASRGALWFFAFCVVWAGLAVALSQPPFSYSSQRIGGYALAGLLGIVATRVAGAWTDRVGARRVVLIGLVIALVAAATLGLCLPSPAATLAGLGLFDAGLFAAQVANQSTVLAIDPVAPARFNSAYMVVYFIGGTLGTAFGAAAVGRFGWPAATVTAAGAIALAIIITAAARPVARSLG
jgi:predicted MFS family arabinose efflux permease